MASMSAVPRYNAWLKAPQARFAYSTKRGPPTLVSSVVRLSCLLFDLAGSIVVIQRNSAWMVGVRRLILPCPSDWGKYSSTLAPNHRCVNSSFPLHAITQIAAV
uniref:Uncharacterized protein n=1 Tax=Arundo donax TaxID=35708 RepID=A0A0A9CJ13_ARUDO